MWAPHEKAYNVFRHLEKTTTPLGVGGEFASDPYDVSKYQHVRGGCKADQGGTLLVEFSSDKSEWIAQYDTPYTAGDPLAFKVPVSMPYCRVRFLNGATAQGSFHLEFYATL